MKPLVIIAGPTAIGKTALSIELAKRIDGEIISADSMQVYRHMDIGTAKVTLDEMRGVPHYMTDIIEPFENFNVSMFKQKAIEYIEKIYEKKKLPILVGGTGFYVQAVLYDINFSEYDDESAKRIRRKYEDMAKKNGGGYLHDLLRQIDPEAYLAIPSGNIKRVIRALEYHELTGEKISVHNKEERERQSAYNAAYFVLTDERKTIYENIDRRVDIMMEAGLLDEVFTLHNMGVPKDSTAMQGLGYKQLYNYLDGECTLDEAVYKIKLETRHFAKRQLTWYRREKNVIFIDKSKIRDEKGLAGNDTDMSNRILDEMISILKKKGIIDERKA